MADGRPGNTARGFGGSSTRDNTVEMRLTAWVEGRVQGVGFRWWVRANALELGLTGYAENLADGRVKVVAEGPAESCRKLLARLEDDRWPRRPGKVSAVTHRWAQAAGSLSGFAER
jgi:acylphosphatase